MNGLTALITRLVFGRHFAMYARTVDHNFYGKGSRSPLALLAPAIHYQLFGWRKGLDPNPYFQTRWYLRHNADVRWRATNPLRHYLLRGAGEMRDPGPAFDTSWYLRRYADVKASGVNPLVHFLSDGRREGRIPAAPAAVKALVAEAPSLLSGGAAAYRTPQWSCSLADFAARHARYDAATRAWTATGNDPRFCVAATLPSGFLRLRVSATYTDIRRAVADEACFQIFFDYGGGFSLFHAVTYRIADARLDIDDLLLMEQAVTAIRIDPVNSECGFAFSALSLATVDLATATRELYRGFVDKRSGTQADFLRKDSVAVMALIADLQQAKHPQQDPYAAWVAARRIDAAGRERLADLVGAMTEQPRISVLMPTYRSDLTFLDRAIQSVREQVYPNWELCIVDDGSADPALEACLDRHRRADPRIAIKMLARNGGISAATNEALGMAGGAFVAFLDHDDEIPPHALLEVAQAVLRHPDADMLYSDEDKIGSDGVRHAPFFKPDWSPEFLLSCMYTCHLGVYRRALVEEIGALRPAFDFAQDYDLALRASVRARRVVHIPDILYHWRTLPLSTATAATAKPAAEIAARAALQDHLDAQNLQGEMLPGPFAGSHRAKLAVIGNPRVSIVIPTAARRIVPSEQRWYLLDLLRSISETSSYTNIEIVLVHNGTIEPALQAKLAGFPLKYARFEGPRFNYSDKVNLGVGVATGEFIILLNDDMTIITPDWIEELVSWLQRPGIAATGAKLLFPDNTVQHAGVLLLGQGPSHVSYGARDADPGQAGSAVLVRNYSAVTAACLALRKATYEAVSGFDPSYRVNYNDVDFCLRLREHGRIVYTPFAKLYHYESVSRDDSPPAELSIFNAQWDEVVGFDPYYNRNLSQYRPYELKGA